MNTNPFHFSQKDTMIMLDDYQHHVERKIEQYCHRDNFPKAADYGVDDSDLSNYLFDKQAILDSRGTQKSCYTIAGLIIMLPVVLLALMYPANKMPWGEWSIFIAVAAGVALWLVYELFRKAIMSVRLKKLDKASPKEAHYAADVVGYNPS